MDECGSGFMGRLKNSYYKNADKVAIKIYLESSALFLLGRFLRISFIILFCRRSAFWCKD